MELLLALLSSLVAEELSTSHQPCHNLPWLSGSRSEVQLVFSRTEPSTLSGSTDAFSEASKTRLHTRVWAGLFIAPLVAKEAFPYCVILMRLRGSPTLGILSHGQRRVYLVGNLWFGVVMGSFGYLVSQRNGCWCCLCVAGTRGSGDSPQGLGRAVLGTPGPADLPGCVTQLDLLWGQLWGGEWTDLLWAGEWTDLLWPEGWTCGGHTTRMGRLCWEGRCDPELPGGCCGQG